MGRQYELKPAKVPLVETRYRRIATEIPAPESIPLLEELAEAEPVAMRGQPPIVWDRACGFQVFDPYGNCWIDWSSGVLIANAGHGRQEIIDAITNQASSQLFTTYCFPSQIRARLVKQLASILPSPLEKVFLLTTGSETVECAIKICRTYGQRNFGSRKNVIVSFHNAFHGRTLGAQQAGGIPALKDWIINRDPGFVQVPFPDGFWSEDTSFDGFEASLKELGIEPADVAGVLMETYQGGTAAFAPREYVLALRKWCDRFDALLVFDEVQAGFGRTGKLWGFEHYGVVPDLACFGKGISGSLPLSAVAGRSDIMDLHGPGAMTSTHTGNPVCCAAALASIDLILKEDLSGQANRLGQVLHSRLQQMRGSFPEIGQVFGRGLVAGVICIQPDRQPDGDLAWEVVRRCVESGVLMFSPVGVDGSTIKIAPPLVISEDALVESLDVFEQVFHSVHRTRSAACSSIV
ncbi:MAG TPA: aspartate aminotransferase family protein [Bryobacteraceae bacterium]|nr:aspartate aminotransferase family protein [Bryobacteraceae bacterium]